ncbi:hypothetical protein VP395_15755 [Mariniflexile soesokkakense]|uniref:DUF3828 domain-containing protein n=1 Tax=Mariniflexile soesokkakense TaxID=1343160 RepID=A0ABV0AGX6_9FLAO
MKNLDLILLLLIALSCNNKKEKINFSETQEQIELETDIKKNQLIVSDSTSIANVALSFINGYTENCNQMNDRIEIVEWVNSNHNASQKFKSELKRITEEADKADPELGLGFNPIFNAQDYPDKGFKLVDFDTISGIVNVKDKILDNGFRMKIKLIKEKDKWLVNGMGIINMPEIEWIEK